MADATEPINRSGAAPSPGSLAARVRQRLTLAGVAFDRRAGARRPKGRRRKAAPLGLGSRESPSEPFHARERACLRMVFRELGEAHRTYRSRTGEGVTPALRAATDAFKQEPSELSLVPVAAFLDELGILAW